jgi:hypothetical protein
MVEILCPHCEDEIELDDDASGEFECPLCDGEFEWNLSEEQYNGSKLVITGSVTLLSNIIHGIGALMLIIGLFTNWIVIITGAAYIGPFGAKIVFYDFNFSSSWFSMFDAEMGDPILGITGILFMLLVIGAVILQTTHIVLRVINHLEKSGAIIISPEMYHKVQKSLWPTSLGALLCTSIGLIIIELASMVFLARELGTIPRPSIFVIFLIIILIVQVVIMNRERIYTEQYE